MKYLIVVIIVTSTLTGCSYETLDKAIESKWNQSIDIVNKIDKHQVVLFKSGELYVLSTYEKDKSRYKYSTNDEEGWSFSGETNISFLIKVSQIEQIGNVVWGGLLTDLNIDEVVIWFNHMEDPENSFEIRLEVLNNTF
ncbi:hypothetical protein [Bacillus horti]|uniref:Uncharacterized protein n=1 Tax=Caldalkalibacillus horti TaxID=77523 RepID=A0ABT9W4N3_9BACI|nr:hypothetical protein [Bacillus horti]MDQ0168198.1 hypothetical protein [Bacillus horti]